MVATFNGWDEMPEPEREALDLWEQERMGNEALTLPAALIDTRTVMSEKPGARS
jgi:hypothetical protein